MSIDTKIEVRHPYVGEVPPALVEGFGWWKIDPEWQWVLVVDGKAVAQLLTCNAHGVLLLLRLTALPEAPHGWAVKLFRHVFEEAKKLGLLGYLTWLQDTNESERKLMRIVQRQDGYMIPFSGVCAAGMLETP